MYSARIPHVWCLIDSSIMFLLRSKPSHIDDKSILSEKFAEGLTSSLSERLWQLSLTQRMKAEGNFDFLTL